MLFPSPYKEHNYQIFWLRSHSYIAYRITSNNSRVNYQFSTFLPAGIIGGRELLEGGNY